MRKNRLLLRVGGDLDMLAGFFEVVHLVSLSQRRSEGGICSSSFPSARCNVDDSVRARIPSSDGDLRSGGKFFPARQTFPIWE